ncbi:MAG: hypothetical protein A2451_13880 [Bdellovibrionales bacterium RIFOXYC2_FULL_39_8]|nr:MAG: hypothetical protein A2451_13880 [Bdellovibrionales bacterium RIFOXYC2_FULL_39_8]
MSLSKQHFEIPSFILTDCKNYFHDDGKINRAIRLFSNAKISISYKRGDDINYYIVAGLIKDDRTYSSKVIYKNRMKDTPEGPLTSSCDCTLWSDVKHCHHVIALFLYNSVADAHNRKVVAHEQDVHFPPIALSSVAAVSVLEYGTIIKNPSKLEGAPVNATYSGLQYLLSNNKIISFPLPISFCGKLIVSINSGTNKDGSIDNIRFKYRGANTDADQRAIIEISLFEQYYLFDWKNGRAYQLPSGIQDFIQKIRSDDEFYKINHILNFLVKEIKEEVCEVEIDGITTSEIPRVTVNPSLVLLPGNKKSLLQAELTFIDEQNRIYAPPLLLNALCFRGGELNGFRKKGDAYIFVHEMIRYLKNDQYPINKFLIGRTHKKGLQNIIASMKAASGLVYDVRAQKIVEYSQEFVKELFHSLHNHFSELLFRFAEYDYESGKLIYLISSSAIFSGMSSFYSEMLKYSIKVFYDRNQISTWTSRVRFERRSSATKWFDLELNISKEDWEIISSATASTGLVQTSSGLVLINNEQQELLKFIKKYTRYESSKFQLKLGVDGRAMDGEMAELGGKKFILPFSRVRIFELFELKKMGIPGALTEAEEQLCETLANLREMPSYPIPETMKDVLRPYQATGYNWLRFLYENKLGACLADDMGLGKTLQAISFIESVFDKIQRVLVICPVTILINWEKEIQKFSQMKSHIYHGGERHFPNDVKIILTSYGVMKKEAEDTFTKNFFDILILDEVQNLKNIRSLGSYAARKINAGFKICMTGTPVENDLAEFYNILDLAVPGIWGDLQFIRTSSSQKTRPLARRLAKPFILRRTKEQVLSDLPPKIENTIYLEFSEDEKRRYYTTLLTTRDQIQNSSSKSKYGEILKGLLRLRQSCLWQNTMSTDGSLPEMVSTKIAFLLEQLSQIIAEGHRVIVFSQFTTYLDIIQKAVAPFKWPTSRIDGSQTINNRQAQVDNFQSGKSVLFLISLKAGGVGLNLTAASYVFIMDPWWNPAVESQAVDRAHRIGQLNRLNVYRPVIKDSVEEKVLALQEEKRELFKDLLDDADESFFTGRLTMKDFEHLLS